jgi:hypothetical protein
VNTTPNPKATKKRSGELGPLPLLSPLLVGEDVEDVEEGKEEVDEVAILDDEFGDQEERERGGVKINCSCERRAREQ